MTHGATCDLGSGLARLVVLADRDDRFLVHAHMSRQTRARSLRRQEPARLVLPQERVVAVEAKQLVVRSLLDDAALLENDEPIHAGDRREPVRDRDHGLALHQRRELVLDRELDLAVERGGGLVEHQDGRVLQYDARDRHALALAAREFYAAVSDIGFVARAAFAVGEIGDEGFGLGAHVGERGVKLSGGQRQRVAIARVMVKDAPILLLDEATSALDSEVEAAIQQSLYRLMEGKTVVAIAHRLSTIAAMDRLIVLDEGRIVEEGDHAGLLARGGLYARLWAHQSGGFLGETIDDTPPPRQHRPTFVEEA